MPDETVIHEPDRARPPESESAPTEAGAGGQGTARDALAWRTTLIIWAALTVFSIVWTFFIGIYVVAFLRGKIPTPGLWLVPGDLWPPVFAGKVMLYGGSLQPYTLNLSFVAMPLYAAVMLPVSAIVEIFNIPRPEIPRSMFIAILETAQTTSSAARSTDSAQSLTGEIFMPRSPFAPVAVAYVLLWAIPFLKVVRSLAFALGARRRLWTLQVAAFFLCWFPAVLSYGHLEDGLVVTLLLYGVVLVTKREWLQLAIVLSIALSLKQTAALAVPLFFFFVPKGHRLRFVVVTAALPALLLALVFASDAASAGRSLLDPPTWPGVGGGRTALFITSDDPVLRAGPYRYGAPLLAVVTAVWLRRNRSVPLLLAGLAVVAATRLPFEAVLHMYYAAPMLAFAAVYEKCRRGNAVFATVFGMASLLLFWIEVVPVWLFWPIWVGLTAAATWPVWADVVRRRFGGARVAYLTIAEAGFGTAFEDPGTEAGNTVDAHSIDTGHEDDTVPDDRAEAPSDGVIL